MITPRAHKSTPTVYGIERSTSGATYSAVPHAVFIVNSEPPVVRRPAKPKSVIKSRASRPEMMIFQIFVENFYLRGNKEDFLASNLDERFPDCEDTQVPGI